MVLDNRFFLLKLAASLLLILGGFIFYFKKVEFSNPDFYLCQAAPERFNEKVLYIRESRVEQTGPDYFVIERKGHMIKVEGTIDDLLKGDRLELIATFIADENNSYLKMQKWRKFLLPKGHDIALDIVSLLVFFYVLSLLFRRFRFKAPSIIFKN